MIKINVKNKLGETTEAHTVHASVSISNWLTENVPSYDGQESAPFDIFLNDVSCDHGEILKDGDVLDIFINPKDPLTAVYVVLTIISAVAAYNASKALDNIDQNYQNSSSAGSSIYSPSVSNNSGEPNGIIRELAGIMDVYPDLLVPPHRRFENNEEYIYLGTCVGKGNIFITDENKYVSESKMINNPSDITSTVFEPNDSVSGSIEFENWATSKEVNSLTLTTKRGVINGNWTISMVAASDQMTSKLNLVATEFPFILNEVFKIEETGIGVPAYAGLYQVIGLSGASNETAQVIEVEKDTGDRNLVGFNSQSIILKNDDYYYLTDSGIFYLSDTTTTPSFPVTTDASVVWSGLSGGVNVEGDFRILPPGETSRYSEFDVFAPRGIVTLDADGDESDHSVLIRAWWRDEGDTDWTLIPEIETTFEGRSRNQLGFTVSVDHGAEIVPVFRFQRATLEPVSTSTSDTIEIRAIRSKLESPSSYPDVTTMAVRMRGTNAIARTAQDKISLRGITRKLPTLAEFQAGTWNLSDAATNTYVDYNVPENTYDSEGFLIIEDVSVGFFNGFIYGDFNSTDEYIYLSYNDSIIQYQLPTIGYLNSGIPSLIEIGTVAGESVSYAGDIAIRNSDLDLWEVGDGKIVQSRMLSANNITTLLFHASWIIDFTEPATGTRSFDINPVADKMWIYDANNDLVKTYSITTADDLGSGVTNDAISFDLTSFLGGLYINSLRMVDYVGGEPTKMVVGVGEDVIKFDLPTAGDVSTATLESNTTLGREAFGITFRRTVTDILYTFNSKFVAGSSASQRVFYTDRYVLNNNEGDTRATRSAARFVSNILYDVLGSNLNNMVDWPSLALLETYEITNNLNFDAEFADETTPWPAIKTALAAVDAIPTIKLGKFSVVIEASKSADDFQHIYTPEIMTGDGLRVESSFYDENEKDSVEVEYLDIDSGVVETVRFPTLGTNPTRMQGTGIRVPAVAERMAARQYLKNSLKPNIYTFTTGLDGLNSEYGDYIGIASDLFGSQTGSVVSYDLATKRITLDFDVQLNFINPTDDTLYAAFRTPEGLYSGLYNLTQTSQKNVVEHGGVLDFTPIDTGFTEDATQIVIGFGSGTGQTFIKGALVREIRPSGEDEVEIVAEEYIEEVYDND